MDHDIIREGVKRIRGLPTFSRIRNELRGNFVMEISEEELRESIEEMVEKDELKEKKTTIKGNQFKGYTVPEEREGKKQEEKTEEEEIIDEVFG
ncbi:MAG: hypothetical protein ACLFTQ_02320 [Candidatus Aenigmatarchaeota archaeon]